MSPSLEMPLSEDYGGDWTDSPLPILERLANAAAENPEKLAVASLHQPANLYGQKSLTEDHLEWSYAQLNAATDLLAAGLRAHRFYSPGTALVTFLGNGVEFALAMWTAHRLQCPFVPLNPRNLQNSDEVRYMLDLVGAGIVLAGSPEAAVFDALGYGAGKTLLRVAAGETGREGWTALGDLLARGNTIGVEILFGTASSTGAFAKLGKGIVAALFTSGTTSIPKACPHTDLSLNAFMKNLALGGCSSEAIFCSVLPNNHAMGYFYVLHFWCNGGSVVYPSASFDAKEMARALTAHSCTHTCLVPTALHSLVDHVAHGGLRFPLLQDVCLAGASITPQHLHQIVRTLGAQAVSTGFGMTEGSPVWTGPTSDPEMLIVGEDVTISGRTAPGAHVRICRPDSTNALPRGQPGEIHESGPGVIAGYLVGSNTLGAESFYTDATGRTWFKTGDQAVMHADGRVSIVGRFKDMIIRGGENIAPAAIESILNGPPGVDAQVVAAPDAFAGEVPVAVVRKLPMDDIKGDPKTLLLNAVRTSMGILCIPDEIITLHELGLTDYPRTMSGKVQKTVLRELVLNFRKHNADSGLRRESTNEDMPAIVPSTEQKSVAETVLHVWWRATGIPPAALDREAPTTNFADSITTMRVRDLYRKSLGLTLTAAEMMQHANLNSQMLVLQHKQTSRSQTTAAESSLHAISPPTFDEVQVVIGAENDVVVFKERANAALAPYGFDFDHDVDAVMPTSDFTNVLIRNKIMDSWNFGIAVVADGSTVAALEHALKSALKQSSLLPSFYVLGDDGAPFYVTIRAQQKLYEHCLIDCGSVKTVADFQAVAIQYPHSDHSTYPGLLFHALLYHIEELNSAGVVIYLHHIVHDASSLRLVLEDINTALRKPEQPLRPHVPFKLWADVYQSLRNSTRATLDVNWHARRLATICYHRKALYPPALVLPRQPSTSVPDGFEHGFDAPGLLTLQRYHPYITASVVFKAAMTLTNIARTQHTHALFANFEAARSTLPYWPNNLKHLSLSDGTPLADLDASDVAGPTMSAVVNLIPVDYAETGIDFLTRLQAEQAELTKRAHAPWCRIIEKLNALDTEQGQAGEMLHEAFITQFLTWVPGFLGDYESIRVVQIAIRAALGVCFVAGLGGPRATTFMVALRWDHANFSEEETRALIGDVEKGVLWLLEEKNWARPVGEFLDGLA